MSSFERKFGKYAVKNLSFVLILFYAVGYLLQMINPMMLVYLMLDPYEILHGQVWRLVTWIMIPPPSGNIFFTLIMLYFYCSIGTTLERTWGTYRYNVYLFQGMLFTILGSFLLLGYHYLFHGDSIEALGAFNYFYKLNGTWLAFSTYYINMSIFLAFAMTFPEIQVFLFFVVPIKVKVLGIIYAIMLVVSFLSSDITQRFVIGASLLNVVAFFLCTRNLRRIDPREIRRRRNYQQQIKTPHGISKHKCAICGRTEKDGEDLEFRFCSKCNGNYEYCQEHLFTHEHVK